MLEFGWLRTNISVQLTSTLSAIVGKHTCWCAVFCQVLLQCDALGTHLICIFITDMVGCALLVVLPWGVALGTHLTFDCFAGPWECHVGSRVVPSCLH